jgi:uncharacterized membrane protein
MDGFHRKEEKMFFLVLGLLIFLGVHSVRIVADGWRSRRIERLGLASWKGLYAAVALIGFVLICWGYGLARQHPLALWNPPVAMRHVAALLVLFSFVLLAAAYVPRNSIKARVHHPMVVGVKVWAVAHLLSNGNLADVVLFGSFLAWAVLDFSAARRRDRSMGVHYPAGTAGATATTVGMGAAAWVVFALWLHSWLIGVRPFG